MNSYLGIINGGEEFIWWSERTGWGQLYRYDSEGNLMNRITSGHFMVAAMSLLSIRRHKRSILKALEKKRAETRSTLTSIR
jgi:hypothetical protein